MKSNPTNRKNNQFYKTLNLVNRIINTYVINQSDIQIIKLFLPSFNKNKVHNLIHLNNQTTNNHQIPSNMNIKMINKNHFKNKAQLNRHSNNEFNKNRKNKLIKNHNNKFNRNNIKLIKNHNLKLIRKYHLELIMNYQLNFVINKKFKSHIKNVLYYINIQKMIIKKKIIQGLIKISDKNSL